MQQSVVAGPLPFKMEASLGEYLLNGLRSLPQGKTCQVKAINGESQTVHHVLTKSVQVASGLRKLQVETEDVIAIVSSHNYNSIPLTFGAIFHGAAPFPLDPSMKHVELCHMFKLAKPKLVFTLSDKAEDALKALDAIGQDAAVYSLDDTDSGNIRIKKFSTLLDLNVDVGKYEPTHIPNPDEQIAAIVQSSGTTGLPKGVASSHTAYLMQLRVYEGGVPKEPFLQMTPLFWISGFIFLIISARVGYLRVYPVNNQPENILNSIEQYKIGWFMIAPIHMARILDHPKLENYNLSSLKWIFIGGSSVPTSTINRVHEKIPQAILQQGYGASEVTGPITSIEDTAEIYAAGKPLSWHEVKIVDVHTRKTLGSNKPGEILIKSPALMRYYLSYDDDKHSGLDNDGFYLTGDVGYLSENGYIYITGRIKELIKVKNHQVSPAEIENVIRAIPGVADVAVVGIPHEIEQNHPRALVIKIKGADITEQQIVNEVADKLSESKHLIGGAQFVETIPRNASGKIMRNQLLKLVKM